MNIINSLSALSLAGKVVRGVAAGASEFASLLAQAGSASSSGTTSGTGGSAAAAVASSGSVAGQSGSPLDDFLAYMKLSPGEKLRYGVMKEMKLTQEQLDAMPPEERQKVEDEIAQRIREKIKLQADSGSQPVVPTATPVALMQTYSSERKQTTLDLLG